MNVVAQIVASEESSATARVAAHDWDAVGK